MKKVATLIVGVFFTSLDVAASAFLLMLAAGAVHQDAPAVPALGFLHSAAVSLAALISLRLFLRTEGRR